MAFLVSRSLVVLLGLALTKNCSRIFSPVFKDNLLPICHATLQTDGVKIYSSVGGNICVTFKGDEFCGEKEVFLPSAKIAPPESGTKERSPYLVTDGAKVICKGSFVIPTEKMKFAVIGDTSYKTGFLDDLVKKISDFSPHVVFHVGDFQYDTHRDRWDKLLSYLSPLFENHFFHLTAGNHEYESENDRKLLIRYFPYEGEFFFRWKDVEFLGVNTFKEGWYEKLKAFVTSLEREETDSDKEKGYSSHKKMILFIHKPFVSISGHREFEAIHMELFKILMNRITVVFAGHDHLYGRVKLIFPHKEIQMIISGGGGARLYGCPKDNTKEIGPDEELSFTTKVIVCEKDFNVVLCEIDTTVKNLSCQAVSVSKGVIDTFSVALK